jgi:hypothetical protein
VISACWPSMIFWASVLASVLATWLSSVLAMPMAPWWCWGHHPQPHRVERASFGGAAGMSTFDTADGCFMKFAYGWAFAKPVRKIFCDITITALSVAVARQRADGWA